MKNLLSFVLLDSLILLIMVLAVVLTAVSSVQKRIISMRRKKTGAKNLCLQN